MKYRRHVEVSPKILLGIFTSLAVVLFLLSYFFSDLFAPFRMITGYVIVPMQKGINEVGTYFSEKIETLKENKKIKEENKTLKEKNTQLAEENKKLQQDKYELDRLQKLYELDQQYSDYSKVGAKVIGKDSGNWFQTFLIDKGSNDGLEVDMNVLAGNGLCGIITEVGPNYAKVRTIIDEGSSVSGQFLRTSDLCIVSGDKKLMEEGYINVEFINKDADISDGDQVVTSHVSEKYLEGITIGYISDIKVDPTNLTKTAHLTPCVDFRNLQEVLVIKQKKQTKDGN